MDEAGVCAAMELHVRCQLIGLIGVAIHAVILGVALHADACLRPGVMLVVAQEIPLVAVTRGRLQAHCPEFLVAVQTIQVLELSFVVVAVQAGLHLRDVPIGDSGAGPVGGVAHLAGILHSR